jgi:hypothetical protein
MLPPQDTLRDWLTPLFNDLSPSHNQSIGDKFLSGKEISSFQAFLWNRMMLPHHTYVQDFIPSVDTDMI